MTVVCAKSLEPQQAPDSSSSAIVSLDELDNAVVRTAASYWRMLKGPRGLPSRAELSPRELRGILKHFILLKVIDGGRDYEYRITGDAQVQAYGFQFRNMRISQIAAAAPDFGKMMYELYEHVRLTAEPYAVRGWVGREVKDARFVYYESVFLPLGDDGQTVDHLAVVSMYIPKAPD